MKRILTTFCSLALIFCATADAKHHKSSGSAGEGRIIGTVRLAGGRTAGFTSVSVRRVRHHGRSHPRVDAAGHFSLMVHPGTFHVSASRYGMGHASTVARVSAGGTTNVTLTLSGSGPYLHWWWYHHHHHYWRHELGLHHHHWEHDHHHVGSGKTAGTGGKPASHGGKK